jgi:hypothetical protein
VDGSGDYVVVWTSTGQDDENDPNGKGVYFQLYNSDGTEKGTPTRVNNIVVGDQKNASVAMDEAGDFVVVWESEQADGTYDIYAQRFNADGSRVANDRVDRIDDDPLRNPAGFNELDAIENFTGRNLDDEDLEVLVNGTRHHDQFNAEVAMDSYGNYAIVWGSASSAYSYFNKVNVQFFDYDGEPMSDEIYVNDLFTPGSASTGSVPGFKVNPTVAMDDNGRITIFWDQVIAQSNGVAVDTEIVGVLMALEDDFSYLTQDDFTSDDDNDADSDATAITIEDVSGDLTADLSRAARNPQVAMDSYGRGVLVYEAYLDEDNVDEDDTLSYGIYYSTFVINEEEAEDTGDDDETDEPPPQATELTIEFENEELQANLVLEYEPPDEDNDQLSPESEAALAFVGNQVNPGVAMDANGGFAITWSGPGAQPDPLDQSNPDLLADKDESGVWVRWFNPNGDPTTVQQRVNVTEAGDQRFPAIAMSRDGDVVVAWAGAGVGDRHGVFTRQYDSIVNPTGPLATELYHKGENPNVGAGDSYLFIADGDQIYGNPTSLLVIFSEEMDTSMKTNNTPGIHSVENVSNWALINGKYEEVSGAIDHVDFYKEETLNKWVAEVFFAGTSLENGTYTLIARTDMWDADGNVLDKTGYRPNGTGMNYGELANLDDHTDDEEEEEPDPLYPLNSPTGGFGFQFGVNNTLPGDPEWGDVDQQVNNEEFGQEDNAAIARNASGNYVVAWVEYVPIAYYDPNGEGTDTTNDDDDDDDTEPVIINDPWFYYEAKIMVQQFDFWGREVDSATQVNTLPMVTDSPALPMDVAIDDAGNFVVVWSGVNTLISDYTPDGEDEDGIFMQRFDYDGYKMGGQVRVNQERNEIQTDPSVAMVGATGDIIVTWTSFEQDGNQDAIVARQYSLSGAAKGDEFVVNTYTYGAQRESDVACDAAGNFVVTWKGEEYNGSGWGIYARRFKANGSGIGNEFHVNNATANDQITPAVAMDTLGNYVVTWASYVQSGNNVWDIYARRYNSSGTALGSNFLVNQTTVYNQIQPDVAMSTGKGFVITWASYKQDYPYNDMVSNYGIYARMYNSDGTNYVDERVSTSPIGEFQVNANVAGDQINPAVSMDAGGHYVVVWTGPNRPDTAGWIEEGDEEDLEPEVMELLDELVDNNGLPIGSSDDDDDDDDNNNDDEEENLIEGIYLRRLYEEPDDDDDTGGTTTNDDDDVENPWEDPNAWLQENSTSIYSRLIDPPIEVVAATEPQDVTIMGTSGNDTIEFIGGPSEATWVIKVNGTFRSVGDNVGTLTLDGLGGNDTLIFTGSGEDDVITLASGSSSFISSYYTVLANHVESVTANAGTGDNTVTIQDTSANDTLTIEPNFAELVGDGVTLSITNCTTVITSSTAGQDTVLIYDSTGNDTFTVTPTTATMTGNGYNVVADGFRYVKGYSTSGEDSAELYDSDGDDLLTTGPAYAKMTGNGFYSIANNFRYITANAGEGRDTAKMYDSVDDDEFESSPIYSKFTSDSYYVRADYFEVVNAFRTEGGNDTATFYGTSGNDTLIVTQEYAKLISEGKDFEVRVNDFLTIKGYGQGGHDTAIIHDTSDDDILMVTDTSVRLVAAERDYRAFGFSDIDILAINGGANTATILDTNKTDLLEAEGNWLQMSNDELEYTYTLLGFDQITAYSTNSGDKKDVDENVDTIDYLLALGLWEDID